MNSPSLWTDAWASALPAWQAALRQSGWHPVVAAAADATVALLCLAAARSARAAGQPSLAWTLAGGALLALAMNKLFALDLLGLDVMRGVARASGWYEARRGVQAVALVAIGIAGLLAWAWHLCLMPAAQASAHAATPVATSTWLLTGLALLATLATLRAVSLHATDELINSRLACLTVGRLGHALGLGLVATAVWLELRGFRAVGP